MEMSETYLNSVLIYLQQELPDYRGCIQLTGGRFILTIPDTGNFQHAYEAVYQIMVSTVNRIRNRDLDLEFTVKTTLQERDFKIWK